MLFRLQSLSNLKILRTMNVSCMNNRTYASLTKPSFASVVSGETYEMKNARLKRPLSPHLTIYKPQLTSMLSITHRFSGIILTGYVVALAALPFTGINLVDLQSTILDYEISQSTIYAIKMALATPVAYHIANGIRHLIWDSGMGLTIKSVYASGYFMLAMTMALSVIFAFL